MAEKGGAKRYAQAVFELALEGDNANASLDGWVRDLRAVGQAVSDPSFKTFLEHAKIPLSRKTKALREVLPNINPKARNLVAVVVSKGLVERLPRIEQEFVQLVDKHRGIERVSVTSAVPLNDQEKQRIGKFVEELTGKRVVLDTRVDASILGGLLIKVGDRVMDGSVKSKLEGLRSELERAPVGSRA
ncbi:MAG: ATP synthase F1 subunit delta [SAR202 cluster bacterium]|nr:ATP synthase F1 subunit delta [SAR202 cluster bacterium]